MSRSRVPFAMSLATSLAASTAIAEAAPPAAREVMGLSMNVATEQAAALCASKRDSSNVELEEFCRAEQYFREYMALPPQSAERTNVLFGLMTCGSVEGKPCKDIGSYAKATESSTALLAFIARIRIAQAAMLQLVATREAARRLKGQPEGADEELRAHSQVFLTLATSMIDRAVADAARQHLEGPWIDSIRRWKEALDLLSWLGGARGK